MKRDVTTIREAHCTYIQSTDERKITALYNLPEEQIEPHEWWQDENVVKELEERDSKMEEGKDKGVSKKSIVKKDC